MGIKCRMVDFAQIQSCQHIPEPGDMWMAPVGEITEQKPAGTFLTGEALRGKRYIYGYQLSEGFTIKRLGQRGPLFVCVKPSVYFCIDSAITGQDVGWDVSGEPPNITVSPSINIVNIWHGWLHNGELTEV